MNYFNTENNNKSTQFANFVSGRHLFSLAHAATGYHKVLEENRKLYNQVQDLKGAFVTLNIYAWRF